MPWTGKSFAAKHNHSLSGKSAAKAASIANGILRSGGSDQVAIATANKRAKLRKSGMISNKQADKMGKR